jgi:tRNA A37 threonylcarbamoyltransferase TsaD
MVETMARERNGRFFVPARALLVDNGAMIAWTGLLMRESGLETPLSQSQVRQKFRTDEVTVPWRES